MLKWVTVISVLLVAGCMKPIDKPVFVQFGTSDTAFEVQLEGEGKQADLKSEGYLENNLIQARRIQISYRWVPTGRWYNWYSGRFLPNEQVIVVDRKPETREWTPDESTGTSARDEAIWVESKDSVGFSTGISITARIDDTEDAIKFLWNYPARPDTEREVDLTGIRGKENYQVLSANLAQIMDTEVRTKVQAIFADEAAKYEMDDLREKKNEILSVLRGEKPPATVGPDGKTIDLVVTYLPQESVIDFFAERGVSITAIGMFGGFQYENPAIQESIDLVFQEQQDKNVAIAEREAAEERKEALRLKGEGAALEVEETAKGEAAAIQAIADAKAYELDKLTSNPEAYLLLKRIELETERLQVWDGRYPAYYIGTPLQGISGEDLNLFLPQPPAAPPRSPPEKADETLIAQ